MKTPFENGRPGTLAQFAALQDSVFILKTFGNLIELLVPDGKQMDQYGNMLTSGRITTGWV